MGIKFNPLIFGGFDLSGGGAAGSVQWKQPVADEASLPMSGNAPGDARVVLDTDKIYVWDDSTSKWIDTNLTTAAFGATPNAEGITLSTVNETVSGVDITRPTINLEPADATNPGAVSTTTQSFAGDKTFVDSVIVEGLVDAQGGVDSTTGTLDIGATASSINIGAPGATVTIQGDTTYEHVTNLYVKDKTITINDGGGVASGGDAGIEVEEDGSITGYAQVSSDRNTWQLKAPNQAGVATIDAGAAGITIDQSSHDPVTLSAVGSTPNADGATLTGQVLNLEPADGSNPGVVTSGTQSFGGDKTFDNSVTVVGSIDAQTSIGSSTGTLVLGDVNTTTINLGDPSGATTSILQTGVIDSQSYGITNVGQLTTAPTTNDNLYINITDSSNGVGTDTGTIGFQSSGVESADITFRSDGILFVESTKEVQVIGATQVTLDSPVINIGQSLGTTDIIGTVTIEYNPADPTDWAPAPDDVIEAIDQLAERFVEQDQVTNEPTGFPNRTDSTISFNDLTREFTIAPVSASFDFYLKGQKFTKTTAQVITLPNSPGDHYIYFDATGSLTSTQTFSSDIITLNAIVSIVYWNTDTNTHTYFGEERHGLTMDGVTHAYLHTVFGARYLSGLALQNFTIGSGGSNADAQFTSDQGSIRDEDILHVIPAQTQIPILYRQGQLWRKKAADAYPVIYSSTDPGSIFTGANGRLPYNQYTGGAWQLTQIGNSEYVLVHFFGTNDKDNPVVGIQGINVYNSAASARIGANVEISSLSGMPFAEFVPVGSVIFESANSFGNAIKARVYPTDTGANYVDFRGTQLYTPAGTATTHGLLSGLNNDDHIQYLLVDGTRAMSGALDMGTHQINNVTDGVASDDAATVGQLTTAITGSTSYFAGFDPTTGILTEVPGYTFDDSGSLQIGAQNSITIPAGVTDYISVSISPTVSNTGLSNLSAVQINSPINQTVATYTPVQVFGYGASAPTNFNAYNSQTSYTGVGSNITHYLASGSSDCTGTAIAFRHDGTGDAGTIQSVNLVPSGDANTIEGVSFAPTGTYTDATGLKVDLSSATITNRPVGLDITGGTLNSGVTFSTTDSLPTLVDSGNVIRPVFEVDSVGITGTDVLMTNLAGFMDFKGDHTGTGPLSLDLGVASVGFVSQVAVDATKTADSITMSLAGLAIDGTSAGGSVTDAHLYRGSAFSFGGALTIDNLYGLKIENTLSDKATNAWGISVEDSGAENYLAKSLKIGGSTATTNNEIAIEIGSNKSIRVGLATTAQRTAFANLSGLVIYDTDLNKFFGNNGSQWIQLNLSIGDIDQTSFPASDNQSSAANITSFAFSNAVTRGFEAVVTIERGSTYAEYTLKGIQKSSSWEMSQDYIGDDTGIDFSVTSSGQIQYTSTSTGSGATIKFRAKTV